MKHAQEFLIEGCKLKAYVFFKGRSILLKEKGEVLLLRFANDLEDLAKVDSLHCLKERMIIMSRKNQIKYHFNKFCICKMKTNSVLKKGLPYRNRKIKENMLVKRHILKGKQK